MGPVQRQGNDREAVQMVQGGYRLGLPKNERVCANRI